MGIDHDVSAKTGGCVPGIDGADLLWPEASIVPS